MLRKATLVFHPTTSTGTTCEDGWWWWNRREREDEGWVWDSSEKGWLVTIVEWKEWCVSQQGQGKPPEQEQGGPPEQGQGGPLEQGQGGPCIGTGPLIRESESPWTGQEGPWRGTERAPEEGQESPWNRDREGPLNRDREGPWNRMVTDIMAWRRVRLSLEVGMFDLTLLWGTVVAYPHPLDMNLSSQCCEDVWVFSHHLQMLYSETKNLFWCTGDLVFVLLLELILKKYQ